MLDLVSRRDVLVAGVCVCLSAEYSVYLLPLFYIFVILLIV